MGRRERAGRLGGLAVALVILGAAATVVGTGPPRTSASRILPAPPTPAPSAEIGTDAHQRAIAEPPLRFEPNVGQADGRFAFVGRGAASLLVAPGEVVIGVAAPAGSIQGGAVAMRFLGVRAQAFVEGAHRQPATVNYLVGDDPVGWRRGLPTYAQVVARDVYPGIDAVYREAPGGFEYDLLVAPGADPGAVQIAFEGVGELRLDGGDVVMATPQGATLRQHRPVAYQDVDGRRRSVAVDYVLEKGRLGLAVGAYDPTAALVVDPVLAYSTYIGGSGNGNHEKRGGVAAGPDGSVYIAGRLENIHDFPTTPGSVMPAPPPGPTIDFNNGYVAKFDAKGALVWSTYLGSHLGDVGEGDYATDIAVDARGDAYVVGTTAGPERLAPSPFPTTPNAYRRCLGAATNRLYLTKLDRGGSTLEYSTCIGPAQVGEARVAVDAGGRAFVVSTPFQFFPVKNGVGGDSTDVAMALIDTTKAGEDSLVFSTIFGGAGHSVPVDVAVLGGDLVLSAITISADFPTASDNLCPGGGTGSTLSRFTVTPSGAPELVGSACFGGDLSVAPDTGHLFVAGQVSTGLVTTANAFQRSPEAGFGAFLAELDLSGPMSASLRYLSYAGGGGHSRGSPAISVAATSSGHAYLAAGPADLPRRGTLPGSGPLSPDGHVVVHEFDTSKSGDESLVSSVTLGGTAEDYVKDIAADGGGGVWIMGLTKSRDFPLTVGAFQTVNRARDSVFVAHLRPSPVIRSLAPAVGPACGGTPVVVTGTRLSGTTATLGETAALGRALSDTSFGLVTPAHGPGPVELKLTDAQGGSDTGTFTYQEVATPAVSGVAPVTGPVSGGTVVTITGASLSCARSVSFDGVAATNLQVLSDTQLSAVTPAHGPGAVDVSVTIDTGNGTATSPTGPAARFTYFALPVVSSITPTCGPLAGGTRVAIAGSGLIGATQVRFGDTAAVPQPDPANPDGALSALSPPAPAPTAASVTVVTPVGTSAGVSNGIFTYPCAAPPAPDPGAANVAGGGDRGAESPPAPPTGTGGGGPSGGFLTAPGPAAQGTAPALGSSPPGGLVTAPGATTDGGLTTAASPAATPAPTPAPSGAPAASPSPAPGPVASASPVQGAGTSPAPVAAPGVPGEAGRPATRHAMVGSNPPSIWVPAGLVALSLLVLFGCAGLSGGPGFVTSTALGRLRPQEA